MKKTIIILSILLGTSLFAKEATNAFENLDNLESEVLIEISNQLLAMGQAEYKKGEIDVAVSLWERAIEIRKSLGWKDTKETGNIYFLVSVGLAALGDSCGSIEPLNEAIRIYEVQNEGKNLNLAIGQRSKMQNSCSVATAQ